ncbi:MAG: outer membrane beta-barrel protein [Pseudomonadota bacterium]
MRRRLQALRRGAFALAVPIILGAPPANGADLAQNTPQDVANVFAAAEEAAREGGFYFGSRSRFAATHDTEAFADGAAFGTSYDVSMGGGALLGYDTGPRFGLIGLRGEFEVGYFQTSADEQTVNGVKQPDERSVGTLTGFTGFANAYLDAHLQEFAAVSGTPVARVKPFVGAGVGVARVGLEDFGTFDEGVVIDSWDTSVAFQLSAGLRLAITERMSVELGYRREMIPELEFQARDGTDTGFDLTRDVFTVGLQRRF